MTYHWIECSITMFTEIRVKRFRYLNKRWLTININRIQLLKSTNPEIIKFSDGISRYSFNKSKSVLYLSFSVDRPLDSFIYHYNKDFEYYIENILPKSKNKESKNNVVLNYSIKEKTLLN